MLKFGLAYCFIEGCQINIATAYLSEDFLSFSFPDINHLDFNAKHGNTVKRIGCYSDYKTATRIQQCWVYSLFYIISQLFYIIARYQFLRPGMFKMLHTHFSAFVSQINHRPLRQPFATAASRDLDQSNQNSPVTVSLK